MAGNTRPPGIMDTNIQAKGSADSDSRSKASPRLMQGMKSAKGLESGTDVKAEGVSERGITRPRKSKSSTSKTSNRGKAKKEKKHTGNKIIVAIDFGSTFSGIAYVGYDNCDARDVQVLTEWPGAARNEQLAKVPSRIAYASENLCLGDTKVGYQVRPGLIACAFMKLALDNKAAKSDFDNLLINSNAAEEMMRLPEGMTIEEVVTDYFKHLYDCVMKKLEATITKPVLNNMPISWWITVPAQWSIAAQKATSAAAGLAGCESAARPNDDLNMIFEAEAAAIAILSNSIQKNQGLYKLGMTVLVADLGGLTLDFQCLTIDSLYPLKTSHTCLGTSGKSGAMFIDLAFQGFCEEVFGEAYTSIPYAKRGAGSPCMQSFETVKKLFDGDDMDQKYHVTFPVLSNKLKEHGIETTSYEHEYGEIVLTSTQVRDFFEPVVQKAFGLMRNQRQRLKKKDNRPVQVVAMAGGLGMSAYMQSRFNDFCAAESSDERVSVVIDERAWSAVARGAAIRGLEGAVVMRSKLQRSYGIEVHQDFVSGVDDENKSFICPSRKTKRAEGYMSWPVKRNSQLIPGKKRVLRVYVPYSEDFDEDELRHCWKLYSSPYDSRPKRVDDPGVEIVGNIIVDLVDLPRKKLKRLSDSSPLSDVTELDITLELALASFNGIFEVKAKYGRTVVGEAEIDDGKNSVERPCHVARSAGAR